MLEKLQEDVLIGAKAQINIKLVSCKQDAFFWPKKNRTLFVDNTKKQDMDGAWITFWLTYPQIF